MHIARELDELREKRERLDRERRKAMLSFSDALFEWWVTSDLLERRWNTQPPPLTAEQAAR